jgi:hypothetical protein
MDQPPLVIISVSNLTAFSSEPWRLTCRHKSVILRRRTFRRFQHLDIVQGYGAIVGCVMTGHTQLAVTPRDRFLEAAQKELIAFERREREFSKKERQERAAQLQIPLDRIASPN